MHSTLDQKRMKAIKHILVPTDFERASERALELATTMALAFDAKVTLVHVWEIPVYPYMDFMLNSDVITRVEDAAVKRLEEGLVALRKVLPNAESKLKTGLAWQGIIDAMRELKPDLVVMGTHGRHGLGHAILGSVAEKIVRMSDVPVLTVRAATQGPT
jgi:nucleotide-binding universal stress UspA family protein